MFDGLKDMGKLLKQAGEMKAKMKKVQEELKRLKVTGTAEDGKIEVTLSGELECLDVIIDPAVASSAAVLQRGLKKAFNDASRKAKELATSRLGDISGGLDLPGM
jgi:DNA-binding YbaB/EbfC family protein